MNLHQPREDSSQAKLLLVQIHYLKRNVLVHGHCSVLPTQYDTNTGTLSIMDIIHTNCNTRSFLQSHQHESNIAQHDSKIHDAPTNFFLPLQTVLWHGRKERNLSTDQMAEWNRASASGSVDLGFDFESSQANDFKIGIHSIPA